MEKDDPKPEGKPAGNRPPPRPPRGTAIGLGPGGDGDKKRHFTITRAAEGEGKFIREAVGLAHHGHVIIRIEPNGRDKGILMRSDVSDDTIPEGYTKHIADGIRAAIDGGLLEEDTVMVD